MNRTVKDATIKACHYPSQGALRAHVLAFVTAYSFATHLRPLRWRTPFLTVRDAWTKDLTAFTIDPHHHIPGPNNYDTRGVYEASASREVALVVPLRRNGRPWKAHTTGTTKRNESLRAIRHLGRRLWKRCSGYHRRSLAETAMSRLKRLGERLSARDPAR